MDGCKEKDRRGGEAALNKVPNSGRQSPYPSGQTHAERNYPLGAQSDGEGTLKTLRKAEKI